MSDLQDCVLVVDDEVLIAHHWCGLLEDMELEVCGMAHTADEAIALALEHRPMLVLMDVRLRGTKDGVDAALAIYKSVGSSVVYITGSKEPATLARIKLHHPSPVLFKPVSTNQFQLAVRDALKNAGNDNSGTSAGRDG